VDQLNSLITINFRRFSFVFLSIFIICVLLLPRLSVFLPISLNLRFEDFFTFILLLIYIYIVLNTSIIKNKVFFYISLYYLYLFLITFINIVFFDLHYFAFLTTGKIIQYYIIFTIIFYVVQNKLLMVKIDYLIFYLFTFNVLFGMYQVLIGSISYYGIRSIPEIAPFLSGSIFFHSLVFMYYMNIKYKKNYFKVFSFLSLLTLLATVARLNIMAGLIFLIIFYLYGSDKKNIFKFILGIFCILIILYVSSFFSSYAYSIFVKFTTIFGALEFRYNLWLIQLEHIKEFYNIIIGMGISETNMDVDIRTWASFGNAVDNQYLRFIIEIGIIGIIFWLISIYNIFSCIKNKEIKKLTVGYIIGMIVTGIGADVFFVSKPGVLFFIFITLFYISSFHIYKKNKGEDKIL